MAKPSDPQDEPEFRVCVQRHPSFGPPGDGDVLWRYCDMEKYVSILATGCLWFSRADLLGDPFEGSLGLENQRLRTELYRDLTTDVLDRFSVLRNDMRQHVYANCWHQNSVESAAMWSLYADQAGIAVVSDFGRIRKAIGEIPAPVPGVMCIHAGLAKYVGYETAFIPEGNFFDAFMHKRSSYEHEREVRLVVMDLPTRKDAGNKSVADCGRPSPAGLAVPADLAELVREVRVSSKAPGWMFDAIEAVTSRFGLDLPVRQSSLATDPIY